MAAVTHVDAVFEEEAFDESFCPPLPIAAAPLANVTNLVSKPARKPTVSKQVRQDGKRHYPALKQIAEEYAVLQKQAEHENGAEAGLWQLCHRGRATLCAHGAAVPPVKQQAGSAKAALEHLVRSFVPEEGEEPLSIGSIPHACGEACSAGACRFHKKGKCFDGLLCRFCHCGGEHAKPAKPPRQALPRAPQRGRAMEPVDVGALQALFAALDSAVPLPGGRLPMVPEVCTWPPRRA